MKPIGEKDPNDRFSEAFRRWADQPPVLPPAEAAKRVASRIAHNPAGQRPRWFIAAAAAILLAVIGTTVLWKQPRSIEPRQEARSTQSIPLGKGEVLIWLDEKTPLYMTFQSPDGDQVKGERQ